MKDLSYLHGFLSNKNKSFSERHFKKDLMINFHGVPCFFSEVLYRFSHSRHLWEDLLGHPRSGWRLMCLERGGGGQYGS